MGGSVSRTASTVSKSAQTQLIKESIDENCIVIFSKTYCSYCKMAKRVFDGIGETYKAVELDKRDDGALIQETLQEMTGAATVPCVFVNGTFIGGGTETKTMHKEGKLLELIGQCNLKAKSP